MPPIKREPISTSRSPIPDHISDSDSNSQSLSPPPQEVREEPTFMTGGRYRNGRSREYHRMVLEHRSGSEDDEEEEDEGEEEEDEVEEIKEESEEVEEEEGDEEEIKEEEGEDEDEVIVKYEEGEEPDEDMEDEVEYEEGVEFELVDQDAPLETIEIRLSSADANDEPGSRDAESNSLSRSEEPERIRDRTSTSEVARAVELGRSLADVMARYPLANEEAEVNQAAAHDDSPSIMYFAVGADMCETYMKNVCPDAKFIAIGRLDGWMICVDEEVEDVCCYRNVLPIRTIGTVRTRKMKKQIKEEEEEYNTREKVVYGILWEVHENTIYALMDLNKEDVVARFQMQRVEIAILESDNELGNTYGMGWGLKRELREVGTQVDVVVFVGKPGGIGMGEGMNEDVNRGIVEGCMLGIPDEWVESDVRKWVQRPDPFAPISLK